MASAQLRRFLARAPLGGGDGPGGGAGEDHDGRALHGEPLALGRRHLQLAGGELHHRAVLGVEHQEALARVAHALIRLSDGVVRQPRVPAAAPLHVGVPGVAIARIAALEVLISEAHLHQTRSASRGHEGRAPERQEARDHLWPGQV